MRPGGATRKASPACSRLHRLIPATSLCLALCLRHSAAGSVRLQSFASVCLLFALLPSAPVLGADSNPNLNCTMTPSTPDMTVIAGASFAFFVGGFIAGMVFAFQKCHAQRNGRTISRRSLASISDVETISNGTAPKSPTKLIKPVVPPVERRKSKMGDLLRESVHLPSISSAVY